MVLANAGLELKNDGGELQRFPRRPWRNRGRKGDEPGGGEEELRGEWNPRALAARLACSNWGASLSLAGGLHGLGRTRAVREVSFPRWKDDDGEALDGDRRLTLAPAYPFAAGLQPNRAEAQVGLRERGRPRWARPLLEERRRQSPLSI